LPHLYLGCWPAPGRDDDDLELIWLQNNKKIHKNPDFRYEREGNLFNLIYIDFLMILVYFQLYYKVNQQMMNNFVHVQLLFNVLTDR
jgi:hypothetical protein